MLSFYISTNIIVSIILFLFIDYVKNPKVYKLLCIIPLLFTMFTSTPIENSINETAYKSLVVIVMISVFTIFYLLIKEDEENKKQ